MMEGDDVADSTAGTNRHLDGIRSNIAWHTPEKVVIRGYDLVEDLLGKADLGDIAFLELFHRLPGEDESAVFNALLVSLVEHGTTPNSIATRLTYLGAPESLQGAVAAGLLGLGSTFVGTIEGAARFLQELQTDENWKNDAAARERVAAQIVGSFLEQRQSIPGIGHPIHKPLDPRAEGLFRVARERGIDDSYELLMREVAAVAAQRLNRTLPVNVTGAIGAITTTMGLRWQIARGLGVLARAVGLVGHILEEIDQPMAMAVWHDTQQAAERHATDDPA